MRNFYTKLLFILVISIIFYSCSTTKKVPEGEFLLTEAQIYHNGKKDNSDNLSGQLFQRPNGKIFGIPLRLMLYNQAKENADSTYQLWLQKNPGTEKTLNALLSKKQTYRIGGSFFVAGISDMLKNLGEAPNIYETTRSERSAMRLKNHFFNNGFFQTKVTYQVDTTEHKKAKIHYNIQTGPAFYIDSISSKIASEELKPIYDRSLISSLIKSGTQYNADVLDKERDRITGFLRNNGAFDFQKTYINYEVDTLVNPHKANIELIIDNKSIKDGDTLRQEPFRIYTVNKVNYYITDNPTDRKNLNDSITTNGITIFSDGPLNYTPRTITSSNYIEPKTRFSDFTRNRTSRSLGNLKVFSYPSIEFVKTPGDTIGNLLDANVILVPLKRFVLTPSVDVTHSNIQQVGIAGSVGLTWRNVFKGAELLDIGIRGNIGSSASRYRTVENMFFDILEYGADAKLSFPRFLFFGNSDRIIPRRMFPNTMISLGYASQRNIGLDKQNLTSTFNYTWAPQRRHTFSLDLFNLQYVQNLNPDNYFNVYRSSFNRLNAIAQLTNTNPDYLDDNGNLDIRNQGPENFMNDVLSGQTNLTNNSTEFQSVRSISERQSRLTENNLILASNIVFTRSTRFNLNDNDFYTLRGKIESAGNVMSLLSRLEKNNVREDGTRTILDVAYSQYIKTEIDFIKYFDFGGKKVLALRAFAGIAIPYGNSNSIPFVRSYFAGGSNDNRAWQSYRLGPGRSGGTNDFNEANMKLAFSGEYRFNVSGPWNLGLFIDAGNIWNALDIETDDEMTFTGFNSLKDIAIGSGLGIRYDFNFFLVRADIGFKTYNPGLDGKRWFQEYNLKRAVFNVGINYPF